MTIKVSPEVLRNTASAIDADIEHAQAIVNGYLSNQENVMGTNTWSGAGVNASLGTVQQLHTDLQKMLTGAARLSDGLKQAASIMESKDADDVSAYHAVFGGSPQNV